jgi:hypothetical protein
MVDDQLVEAERQLEAALQSQAPTFAAEGALLTEWVVVTDWVMPDGERQLHSFAPLKTPEWISDGLLRGALELEDDDEEEA